MTSDEILQAFDRMRVWQQGDRRAVHKPLLVLFALAKVGAGGTATMDWNDVEPQLVAAIARRIVDAHFPESIRCDVLAAVGLPADLSELPATQKQARRRDPAFREKVLLAYQYRCGVCGHNLRLGNQPIGLEAAHIKWFQARGPDVVPNGIALCALHHKVFDLGAFTILPAGYQMVFSQHLNGSDDSAGKILAYHGASLILPQSREYLPQPEFLDWHRMQVFKNPQRPAS